MSLIAGIIKRLVCGTIIGIHVYIYIYTEVCVWVYVYWWMGGQRRDPMFSVFDQRQIVWEFPLSSLARRPYKELSPRDRSRGKKDERRWGVRSETLAVGSQTFEAQDAELVNRLLDVGPMIWSLAVTRRRAVKTMTRDESAFLVALGGFPRHLW